MIAAFWVRAVRQVPDAEPVGVTALSAADRWWAAAVIGGCALAGAVRRATRWWDYWGARDAKPWDLVPTVCFGAGAGLLLGLLVYAVGVRVWRPAVPGGRAGRPEPAEVSAGGNRPGAR